MRCKSNFIYGRGYTSNIRHVFHEYPPPPPPFLSRQICPVHNHVTCTQAAWPSPLSRTASLPQRQTPHSASTVLGFRLSLKTLPRAAGKDHRTTRDAGTCRAFTHGRHGPLGITPVVQAPKCCRGAARLVFRRVWRRRLSRQPPGTLHLLGRKALPSRRHRSVVQ